MSPILREIVPEDEREPQRVFACDKRTPEYLYPYFVAQNSSRYGKYSRAFFIRCFLAASRARWVDGSLIGNLARISSREALSQRLARKTVVWGGAEIVSFPEVATENLGRVDHAFLRITTSPNSGSLKVIIS